MIKAFQISLRTVDKMSFLYELGSYCLIEYKTIFGDYSIKNSMDDLYDDGYLYERLDLSKIKFETLYQDNKSHYILVDVDSLDLLRALLLSILEDGFIFFEKNIPLDLLKTEVRSYFLEREAGSMYFFQYIAHRFFCSSKNNKISFALLNYYTLVFREPPYGLNLILIGDQYKVSDIFDFFKKDFEEIGQSQCFFGDDKFIDIDIKKLGLA